MADHDLDAERAVLGAVLLDPERFTEAADVITGGAFFRVAHACVWRAFEQLHQRGTPIDFKSVTDVLTAEKRVEDVGGLSYLAGLVDGVPRTSNIGYYASEVRRHAEGRALVATLTSTARAVADDGVTAEALASLKVVLDLQSSGLVAGTSVAHQQAVAAEMARERARRDARRRLDAEERGAMVHPEFATLADRLSRPRAPKRSRIAGWQPWGSNVMLAAQFKAGKTTLRNNLVRSLVDDDPFLGRAHVTPVTGTVVVLDNELPEEMGDQWFEEQRIRHTERVILVPMKGKLASFNILDPVCRKEWAARLREYHAEYLILDCLRPVFDAFGLDENRDAGKFLGPFDTLKADAGVIDACIIHHMGHSGERVRGDSRLRDWPDAEWRLTRETDDPRSPRFITAFGRDVDIPEGRLDFDPASRRMTMIGGSRKRVAASAALDAVVTVLREAPEPMTGRQLTDTVTADTEHKRDAVNKALLDGRQPGGPLQYTDGPNRSYLYTLRAGVPVSGGVRTVYAKTPEPDGCTGVRVPIGHRAPTPPSETNQTAGKETHRVVV